MTVMQPRSKATRASKKTNDLILDTAERLFAVEGLNAVSLRRIAQEANVDAASITYHFGNKEQMIEAVVARRVVIMNEARLKALAEMLERTRNRPTVEDVLETAYRPWLELYLNGDEGGKHYSRLVARMMVMPNLADMFHRHMGSIEQHYSNALRLAVPDADDRNLYWAGVLALGSAAFLFSETPRIDFLSDGLCSSKDLTVGYERLMRFISAGFQALAESPFPDQLETADVIGLPETPQKT